MLNRQNFSRIKARQRGATAVEFGIIAMVFFTLFFGIIEFGRFFYLYNTVQEVTRCAARQAVVNWRDKWESIRQQCLFGHDELVAGREIGKTSILIRHLNQCGDVEEANPGSVDGNISKCRNPGDEDCIRFVEAGLWCSSGTYCDPDKNRITYNPMFGLIPLRVNIPGSTVCMPAESLGYGMTP